MRSTDLGLSEGWRAGAVVEWGGRKEEPMKIKTNVKAGGDMHAADAN
jgi:hypothetical protein